LPEAVRPGGIGLTVAVAPAEDVHSVAAELSLYLPAHQILTVSYTPAQGAELHQV
jgi:hypothetical protein